MRRLSAIVIAGNCFFYCSIKTNVVFMWEFCYNISNGGGGVHGGKHGISGDNL